MVRPSICLFPPPPEDRPTFLASLIRHISTEIAVEIAVDIAAVILSISFV
jgi:hypothetical protein